MISLFLRKTLFSIERPVVDSTTPLLFLHNNSNINNHSLLRFTSSSKSSTNQHTFTITYLINSCGLSPEAAISASERVHIRTPERPDSVVTLFKDHEFTNTQITKLIRARPILLTLNPEKTLLPKLEFFRSIGFSSTELAKILSYCPTILANSLQNQLMPWYNFLNSLLMEDKYVVKAIKKSPIIFNLDVRKNFAPNISVLRELGVPESCILLTVKSDSFVLCGKRVRFNKIVKELIEMGYNPKKTEFVKALIVFCGTKESTREHKMEVFRRWGWSEDEVRILFKKLPLSMHLSEEKISCAMDFLVNRMGCQIAAIARYPLVLQYSLEKRVIPRCSVIKVLLLKGLIKKDLSLSTFLLPNEKQFLDKFVTKYQKDVPQLLNVYQGKMSLLELGFGSEEICGIKQL